MKTANPDINKRMRKAASLIASGTRRRNLDRLLVGRRMSAVAHIENQILLGRALLTPEDISELTKVLYEIPSSAEIDIAHAPSFEIDEEEEDEPEEAPFA